MKSSDVKEETIISVNSGAVQQDSVVVVCQCEQWGGSVG